MREFINRVRMNLGTAPAVNGSIDDEQKKHDTACPHQKIYGANDRTRIYFSDFLTHMARQASIPPELIKINFEEIYLSSDTAIYCGFILKELLASFTRFRPGEKGRVIIDVCQEGDIFKLVVSDYGNHFDPEIDFQVSGSLGAQLIMFLAQQINGTIDFNRDSSEFRLTFSEPGLLESLQL